MPPGPRPQVDLAPLLGRERVADLFCGAYNCFVLANRGTVVGWGLNNSGQLSLPAETDSQCIAWAPKKLEALTAANVRTLRGGSQQTLAITADNKLLSFGASVYGQLGREGVDVGSANAKYPEPTQVGGCWALCCCCCCLVS